MKPILFNTEMVRAIQEGRKTVTRRVVKRKGYDEKIHDAKKDYAYKSDENLWHIGYRLPTRGWPQGSVGVSASYHPGDILWVRETWWKNYGHKYGTYFYRADGEEIDIPLITGGTRKHGKADGLKWRPSIHMPKEAARLFLRVTGVRVERLRDMDADDAAREGVLDSSEGQFAALWDNTIKPANLPLYGWEANPWVWVIEFERVSRVAAQREEGQG